MNQSVRLILLWFSSMACACLIIVLLYLGIFVIQDGLYAKTFTESGTCIAKSAEIADDRKPCMCGQGCVSEFKCAKVYVQLKGFQSKDAVLLHEDQHNLIHYPECSARRCTTDAEKNNAAVGVFYDSYKEGKFNCFYNPENTDHIVINVDHYSDLTIGLMIAIPTILFVIFLFMAIGLCASAIRHNQYSYAQMDKLSFT